MARANWSGRTQNVRFVVESGLDVADRRFGWDSSADLMAARRLSVTWTSPWCEEHRAIAVGHGSRLGNHAGSLIAADTRVTSTTAPAPDELHRIYRHVRMKLRRGSRVGPARCEM